MIKWNSDSSIYNRINTYMKETTYSHRVRLEQDSKKKKKEKTRKFVASWIKVDAGYFRWIGYRIEKKEGRIAEWIGTLSNLREIHGKLFRFAYCRILLNTLLNDDLFKLINANVSIKKIERILLIAEIYGDHVHIYLSNNLLFIFHNGILHITWILRLAINL